MTQHGCFLFVPAGWLLVCLIHGTLCIKITDIQIPNYMVKGRGEETLRCEYDPEGSEIYSIKWYKDQQEFYNFVPGKSDPKGAYSVTGFNVNVPKSTDTDVVLENINEQAAGTYKCEISGEGPNFWTASKEKNVSVIVPPEHGPNIWGHRHAYQPGDTISVNCTASDSWPAARVNWLVNSEQISQDNIRRWVTRSAGGLRSSTAGLRLTARRHHFKGGVLYLKCTVALGDVYWATASLELPLWRGAAGDPRNDAPSQPQINGRLSSVMMLLALSAYFMSIRH